jgi:hypothetical protein
MGLLVLSKGGMTESVADSVYLTDARNIFELIRLKLTHVQCSASLIDLLPALKCTLQALFTNLHACAWHAWQQAQASLRG